MPAMTRLFLREATEMTGVTAMVYSFVCLWYPNNENHVSMYSKAREKGRKGSNTVFLDVSALKQRKMLNKNKKKLTFVKNV